MCFVLKYLCQTVTLSKQHLTLRVHTFVEDIKMVIFLAQQL